MKWLLALILAAQPIFHMEGNPDHDREFRIVNDSNETLYCYIYYSDEDAPDSIVVRAGKKSRWLSGYYLQEVVCF